MSGDFDWIERIERGDATLVEIVLPCRLMEKITAEYSRKYGSATYALAFIAAVLLVTRLFRMSNPSLYDVAMQLIFGLLAFGICAAMILFVRHTKITRPYERYRKALAKAYPGLNVSSDYSVRSCVWGLADEPNRFLRELCGFLAREAAARELADAGPGEALASPEGTVLNVWQTNSLERELDDLGQYHEHEIAHLKNVIGYYRKVGAEEGAREWEAVLAIFAEAEGRRTRHGDAAAEEYLSSGEVRERLAGMEERLAECRPETEAKLRDYALQHKGELERVFVAAQERDARTGE